MHNPSSGMMEHAVAYGRAGWPIFPLHHIEAGRCSCGKADCNSAGKHPRTRRGFKDASPDEAMIRKWWTRWPDANIGIATGARSGLFVLDKDGAKGSARLAKLVAEHGPLPETPRVKTGHGEHYYFRLLPGVSAPSKAFTGSHPNAGLDTRCDRGYVVAPPSMHVSGVRYEWINPGAALAVVPDRLIEYACNGRVATNAAPLHSSRPPVILDMQSGPPPLSEAEAARIRSALGCIPAESYDTWFRIGMGLHWTGWGERACQIYDDWSRTVPEKYKEEDQRKTWDSFGRREGKPITLGTLFHLAKEGGWTDITAPALHTDLGNARRLVARHGSNIRFVHEWHQWIIWEGTHWRADDDGAIMRLAKETVEALYAEAPKIDDEDKRKELRKHGLKCQAAARLDAMIDLARTEPEVVLSAQRLDADPWLLGMQNGVLELQTGKFRPAERDDYITKRTGVAFDPGATCPNWLGFLDKVTGGDRSLSAYLQRVAGYTLTGSTREEVLFVPYGTGNNGKSTFRETLHDVLGDYAVAADAALLIERKAPGGATPEIARLKGRRLVAINETSENDQLNEARVKYITSQDKISARNLYQPLRFRSVAQDVLDHEPQTDHTRDRHRHMAARTPSALHGDHPGARGGERLSRAAAGA
jgi:putative DNA primase/helicase